MKTMDFQKMRIPINASIDETLKKALSEELYICDSDELVEVQLKCLDEIHQYNRLKPSQQKEKQDILRKCFSEIGDNCYIETPFYANWGGKNVHFGSNVYANFNLTLIDDGAIYVGDNVLLGPNVTLVTGTHPIEASLRKDKAQYNRPVKLEANVWLGANVVVLPGVTIGENSIIGASSVVTKDIPSNVVAVGNPCRVIRDITEEDK